MVTLGYAGIEIEAGAQTGRPANLWVLDAGKLYVDYDEHGKVLGYDMLNAYGRPIQDADGVHAWTPDQVIWFALNPMSNSLYPSSRIQQLFVSAVIEDLMMAFIVSSSAASKSTGGRYENRRQCRPCHGCQPRSWKSICRSIASGWSRKNLCWGAQAV